MSMFTARCVVVRCDVPGCQEIAETLLRDGAMASIPGWLEVFPFGTLSSASSCRKFICATHAKLLDLGDWTKLAEIPLTQAIQDPRFQTPDTLKLMKGLDPEFMGKVLVIGGPKAIAAAVADSAKQLPEAANQDQP